jgi:hypothetical protein
MVHRECLCSSCKFRLDLVLRAWLGSYVEPFSIFAHVAHEFSQASLLKKISKK